MKYIPTIASSRARKSLTKRGSARRSGREHDEAEELEPELGPHTRRTATRPKSPPGRTSSSTRMSRSAAGSFNVEPMKPT